MPVLAPVVELSGLLALQAPALDAGLAAAVRAILSGDIRAERAAMRQVGETVAATQGLSHLLGARRVLLERDHYAGERSSKRPETAAYAITSVYSPVVPNAPFRQAVDDIVAREPRLASSAAEVSQLYGEGHAFAMAQSTDLVLTRKVQDVVAQALRNGVDVERAAAVIAQMGDWRAAYARNVFRTNVATAYSAGRLAQATDPDVADIVAGLRHSAVMDRDTRKNHAAGHGYTAPASSPVWRTHRSPLGYQCRCTDEIVDVFRARREGLLVRGQIVETAPPADFHPDPGFRHDSPEATRGRVRGSRFGGL